MERTDKTTCREYGTARPASGALEAADRVREQVRQAILAHGLIAAGDAVVLGFSGGPDSLCLFDVLYTLQKELDFSLSCVHVNHGLRPGDAEEDQAFVESLCKSRGVPLAVVAADCRAAARSLGLTEEEAGRRLRYDAFAERAAALAQQGAARVRIAVAQNRNDQAETVLQRLLRGTGTDGMAGMDYVRDGEDGFAVIRPLLDTARADIEAYLAAADLAPRRDHTNEENTYVRNRIRNELMPYLADNFNPNIIDTLARAAANAREDSAYLKELAAQCFFDAQVAAGEVPVPVGGVPAGAAPLTRICLDRQVVLAAPPAVRHRMLRMTFAALGLVQDIAAVHLAAMDQLIEEGRTSSETNLPGGYLLRIEYDVLVLLPPQKPASQPAGAVPGDGATDAEASARPGETAAGAGQPAQVQLSGTAAGAAQKAQPGRARVLTREELLAQIAQEEPADAADGIERGPLSEAERIRAYIYSKNFAGIREASCVLDADKVEALLAGASAGAGETGASADAEKAGASAAAGETSASATGESAAPNTLPARIAFRTRQPGDRLPLKEGSKSIQNLMVDDKIPRERRNSLLLAAAGNTVLWMPWGMPRPRYAAGCAAGPATERFLVLEMAEYV